MMGKLINTLFTGFTNMILFQEWDGNLMGKRGTQGRYHHSCC